MWANLGLLGRLGHDFHLFLWLVLLGQAAATRLAGAEIVNKTIRGDQGERRNKSRDFLVCNERVAGVPHLGEGPPPSPPERSALLTSLPSSSESSSDGSPSSSSPLPILKSSSSSLTCKSEGGKTQQTKPTTDQPVSVSASARRPVSARGTSSFTTSY